MDLKFSKKKQLAYKKNLKSAKKHEGDRLENTVQSAVDDHLKRKWIKYFRFPDWVWSLLKKKFGNDASIFPALAELFAGWPDNIAFYPITDKYHLCIMIENKSRTGKTHGKQASMAEELNYQIPRSAEQGIAMIEQFEMEAEMIKQRLGSVQVNYNNPCEQEESHPLWYECTDCDCTEVMEGFKFCPECGKPIEWVDC